MLFQIILEQRGAGTGAPEAAVPDHAIRDWFQEVGVTVLEEPVTNEAFFLALDRIPSLRPAREERQNWKIRRETKVNKAFQKRTNKKIAMGA